MSLENTIELKLEQLKVLMIMNRCIRAVGSSSELSRFAFDTVADMVSHVAKESLDASRKVDSVEDRNTIKDVHDKMIKAASALRTVEFKMDLLVDMTTKFLDHTAVLEVVFNGFQSVIGMTG